MDNYQFSQTSLLPMGEGDFIIPLNATIRKGIRKSVSATLTILIAEDLAHLNTTTILWLACRDEPNAI